MIGIAALALAEAHPQLDLVVAGEDGALYTREAPCSSVEAAFGATACHTIALRPDEDLPAILKGPAESDTLPQLRFQVCICFRGLC